MIALIRRYSFPAFFIFVIMAEMIFHALMIVCNIEVASGMLKNIFIPIFIISVFILLHDYKHLLKSGFRIKSALRIIFAIIFFYWITHFFYSSNYNQNYVNYLLVFGVKSIPAFIIGLHFCLYPCMSKIDKLLPFYVIPVGLVIGTMGFAVAMAGGLVGRGDDDSSEGLNYQILSYYMAELYTYCIYYLFYSTERHSFLYSVLRWPVCLSMIFFAIVCAISGGRGGLLFISIITLFVIYTQYRLRNISTFKLFLGGICLLSVFVYFFVKLDIANSVGFTRIVENFTTDDSRKELRDSAITSFLSSPVWGHGFGSVWFEIGLYSHNLFLDILVECGLLGLLLFTKVIFVTIKRLSKLSKIDPTCFFALFLFLRVFFTTLVSGYWIGAYQLWLIFGVVLVLSTRRYKELIRKGHMHRYIFVN